MTLPLAEPARLSTTNHRRLRNTLLGVWIAVIAVTAYLFLFQREAVQTELHDAMSASMFAAGFIYLVLGSLRGFTLLPAAPL